MELVSLPLPASRIFPYSLAHSPCLLSHQLGLSLSHAAISLVSLVIYSDPEIVLGPPGLSEILSLSQAQLIATLIASVTSNHLCCETQHSHRISGLRTQTLAGRGANILPTYWYRIQRQYIISSHCWYSLMSFFLKYEVTSCCSVFQKGGRSFSCGRFRCVGGGELESLPLTTSREQGCAQSLPGRVCENKRSHSQLCKWSGVLEPGW